ncbi:MAG: hypothetical protein P9L96_00525 [Candidatus Gygaella obscura]|nr:hypothetical protein [Candidatus Gygaella obscura]
MTKNKKIIKIESLLTCFLLCVNILLLWQVLSPNSFYFLCIIIAGFFFSSYLQQRAGKVLNIIVNLSVLAVFVFLVISVMNSSFIYKDVVEIFVKKIFLILIIFSFASSLVGYLSYIQVLSACVLIAHALFISSYTLMVFSFVIVYLLIWVLIMRVKLYGYFCDSEEIKGKKYYSLLMSVLFLAIALALAWVLLIRFPIGKFDNFALLLHPNEAVKAEFLATESEKEFSQLEEELVEKVVKFISESNYGTIGDKELSLALFNKLTNQSVTSLEVLQAEDGLIDMLKRIGPGIEKGKDNLELILKQYLKSKLNLNLSSHSKSMMNRFNMNPLDVLDKLLNMNRVNRLNSSRSLGELLKNNEKLMNEIESKQINLQEASKIEDSIDDFRDSKLEELYRKKKEELETALDELKGEKFKLESLVPQQKSLIEEKMPIKPDGKLEDLEFAIKSFQDLLDRVDQALKLDDFKGIEKVIKEKEERNTAALKQYLENFIELSDIKLSIVNEHIKAVIDEKLHNSDMPEYFQNEINHSLGKLILVSEGKQFKRQTLETSEKLENNKTDAEKEIKQLIVGKAFILSKSSRRELKNSFKENLSGQVSNQSVNDLVRSVDQLESINNLNILSQRIEQLNDYLSQLSSKGQLLKKTEEEQKDILDNLYDVLSARIISQKDIVDTGIRDVAKKQDSFERLLEEDTMESSIRDFLKDIKMEIDTADKFLEIEMLLERIDKLSDITKNKLKEEHLNTIQQNLIQRTQIQKAFIRQNIKTQLQEKLDLLRKLNPESAKIVGKLKDKLEESRTDEQLNKILSDINYQIEQISEYGQNLHLLEAEDEDLLENQVDGFSDGFGDRELAVVPSSLVMSIDSSVQPKAFFISGNMFVTDVTEKCQWISASPDIAWIDEKGILHAIKKGSVRIRARFRSGVSPVINVLVVDKMLSSVEYSIEREIAK